MNGNLLSQAFALRMQRQLKTKEAYDAFLATYDAPAFKGLRVNTLKIERAEFEKITPFSLKPVLWEENGFYVAEEKTGRHAHHFAGLFYSQEPSAMSVAPLLKVNAGERVLDLCAAPGGKSTQIAQALQGQGILVCNEINGNRAKILSQNIERLGVKNAFVINSAPESLAKRFPSYFDKVLVDAPCSGEGMFKKNQQEAIENWSEENVKLCAARQKDILSCAAQTLRKGGTLVYSTCTFAEEEDEEQIAEFLRLHPEFTLLEQKKLYPHEVAGEGHFYAVLEKTGGEERRELPLQKSNATKKDIAIFSEFCNSTLNIMPQGVLYRAGDTLYLLPEDAFAVEKLPLLRAGVRAGEYNKERFTPAHALALALKASEAKRAVNLPAEQQEKYLRGETVEAEIENGWCLVCVDGYPLGWGKAVNGTIKNHYPKGLRLVK